MVSIDELHGYMIDMFLNVILNLNRKLEKKMNVKERRKVFFEPRQLKENAEKSIISRSKKKETELPKTG